MSKLPRITIITPAYNREDFLEETIKSVLDQKYPNLEYIIIDDGSSDNTYKIAKKYEKYARVITHGNMGETKTVNKGFSMAHGDIIAVVNSDDPLLPGSIAKIADFMQKNPEILAVYPDWQIIDEKSQKHQVIHLSNYNYLTMLKEHYCMPGPGTFFRKEAIQLTGGRSTKFKYLGDFAFWLKLGMYGQLYHLPKTLATFRVHSRSQGKYAMGKEMSQESKELVAWVYKQNDLPQKAFLVKQSAYASAYYHAAKKSTIFLDIIKYYILSCKTDPIMFFKKVYFDIKKHFKIKKTLAIKT